MEQATLSALVCRDAAVTPEQERWAEALAIERRFGEQAPEHMYRSGEGRGSGGFALIFCGAPVPGEQFVETVLGDVGDAREDVGEPGLRIDVVELCRTDEAQHEGRALTAAV